MSYVIVAFRVDRVNSVLYAKRQTLEGLKRMVEKSFEEHDADFISIRKIRGAEG